MYLLTNLRNGHSNGHSNGYTNGGYGQGGSYGAGNFGGGDKMSNLGANLKVQQWGEYSNSLL